MDKTKALQKLLNGTATKKEIELLKQALASGEISIGGDVKHSIVITGDGNNISLTPEALNLLKPETTTEEPAAGDPPYMGLRYFDTSDADLFYGRETLTRELLARVQKESFLAVVGASGSGKSSVARAGLIPAWQKENERGAIYVITPTAHPLESLAASLTRESESVTATTTLMDDLKNDSRSLRLYVKKTLGESRLLLLVDQFEETFTLCKDADERKAFIENLLSLADAGTEGTTRVVITLRADFYAHCAEYDGLRQALDKHQKYIGAMTFDELRQAITAPAQSAGWDFQPGLVDLILQDVGMEPGALPLLSHALLETWKRRQGRTLTLGGYHEAGGVRKAIAQTAESVYDKLTPAEQIIARGIFLRLTELGEGVQDTRRRVKLDELSQRTGTQDSVAKVLKTLADARLVTTEQDSAEVAHEALIREWGTLRRWLDEDRESLRLHRHLTESAQEWERSRRDDLYLVHRGGRLEDVLHFENNSTFGITVIEKEYIKECSQYQLREKNNLENLRRKIIFGLGLGLLITITLAGFSVYQKNQAQRQAKISYGQALVFSSKLASSDINLSTLLAIESYDAVSDLPHSERILPEQTLRDHLNQIRGVTLWAGEDPITTLSFSPDGFWLAEGSENNAIRIWNMTNLTSNLIDVAKDEKNINVLTYSPDGNWIAVGRDVDIRLYNLQDTSLPAIILTGNEGTTNTLAYSPDGLWLAAGGVGSALHLWDMKNLSSLPVTLDDYAGSINSLAFSLDGNWLAAGYDDGNTYLWDRQNLSLSPIILDGELGTLTTLAFSPDSHWLATGGLGREIALWDMQNLSVKPVVLSGHEDSIYSLAFSSNGYWLATGSYDQTVRLWKMQDFSADPIILRGHEGYIDALAFNPDGYSLVTGGEDGTLRYWDIQNPSSESVILHGYESAIDSLVFSHDGEWLATKDRVGSIFLWDTQNFDENPITLLEQQGSIFTMLFSPDGEWLAAGGENKVMRLWKLNELSNPSISLLGTKSVIFDAAFSPDSNWLAATGADYNNNIALWNMRNLTENPLILRGHKDVIRELSFSINNMWLASGSEDGSVRLWNMQDTTSAPIILYGHEETVSTLEFSPNGKWLATGSWDDTIRLWNLKKMSSPPIVLRGNNSAFENLSFSSDSRWLATASEVPPFVLVWDMEDPSVSPVNLRLNSKVYSLAFSPDGQFLVTGGEDNITRIWDVQNFAAEPIILHGHESRIYSISFNPNGQWLATGSHDNTVRLWNLNYDQLRETACRIAGRNFSITEWVQYFPNEEYRVTCAQWLMESIVTPTANP